jgi:hypothetical protein
MSADECRKVYLSSCFDYRCITAGKQFTASLVAWAAGLAPSNERNGEEARQ